MSSIFLSWRNSVGDTVCLADDDDVTAIAELGIHDIIVDVDAVAWVVEA
jgi:hypothetical protein